MSERVFRLIQGLYLLVVLYFDWQLALYVYLGIIAFEGITNWRIPVLVNKACYAGASASPVVSPEDKKYAFEAERLMRLTVLLLLALTVIAFPEAGWFFPWFIGAMLLMAGISNICPMVMFFRSLGFR